MTSTKLYTAIYVVLFVLATGQVLIEQFEGFTYWTAFAIIMVVSAAKAVVVAAYYQHLRSEPRSVTYIMVGGLVAALALTVAASYSIL
ncbi:cytochrome C oxidase subunit IV family protein [Halorarum halobium]|uniref:cytochrome C oxidase subunit IV family protein n=1 Tax=Halorarum halobium TaxID=3075121 RepID=UPI0028AACDED|nr:cytochrome C oxidase subunit IV family protein [Halobaculum sp. XH14]